MKQEKSFYCEVFFLPQPLYSMPESAQFMKKYRTDYSSGSSCESSSEVSDWEEEVEKEDQNMKKEKKVTYDLEDRQLIERSSKLKKCKVYNIFK